MSFGGQPSLGRFVVVPCSFHFLIKDLMVLHGMFKASDIFLEPNPDTVEVGSLHTLRLESLKLVFQPLHKFLVNKL